jgi:DNA (cytosine-5)-methyltransferase 1
MKTFASLFTGFGGADLGAIAAGLQPVWGVEYDAKIAEVANHNLGQHIQVADILSCDPLHFERPDVLHASPPCPSFSVAKANGQETPHDIAMASKVAEFVSVLTPEIFTLENVYAYRNSKSWRIIENALYKAGYWLHIDHVNSADYGVPQTRKRMIVRAVRGGFVPYLPQPVKWVGWYEAIKDLIPTLPNSQFASWQLERLPKSLKESFFVQVQGEGGDGIRFMSEPAQTISSSHVAAKYRAFIVEGSAAGEDNKFNLPVRMNDEPVFTMRASQNNPRAAIEHGRVVVMTPLEVILIGLLAYLALWWNEHEHS